MTSIDAASTNDISSTARSAPVTEVGDEDRGPGSLQQPKKKSVTLTSDGIIKECIKQGFYRNPICNEKLYLHNKGYDSIAPSAFELYTDVKVLWLEGNALASLPCGGELIRVRPPRNKGALYSSSSSSSLSDLDDVGEATAPGAAAVKPRSRHIDPLRGVDQEGEERANAGKGARQPHRHHTDMYATAASVPLEDRDVFSSLYPTVRQLYLHNNIFRTMPDISRFEHLDSVNLANNFFTRVEPHCPSWDRGLRDLREAQEEEERSVLGMGPLPSVSTRDAKKSSGDADDITVVPAGSAAAAGGDGGGGRGGCTSEAEGNTKAVEAPLSPEEVRRRRSALLADYRQLVEKHLTFCSHTAIPENHKSNKATLPSRKPIRAAVEHRNPCSSLRTLNLAANHIQSFEDLLGLLCYKALSVLDLSQNRIDDGEALLLILERMGNLKSLKLSGNPLVRTLPKYRKTVLARCPGLLHLDDRPVFAEERRLVTAWAAGGESAELRERAKIKEENDAAVRKRVDDFRNLLNSYRSNREGEAAAGRAMDPSHHAYVNAITNPENAEKTQKKREEVRRPNSDPDQSPTSSEEEEEEDGERKKTADECPAASPAAASADAKPPVSSAFRTTDTRVLSSNGPLRRRKAIVEVADEGEEGEGDDGAAAAADVYIPS